MTHLVAEVVVIVATVGSVADLEAAVSSLWMDSLPFLVVVF